MICASSHQNYVEMRSKNEWLPYCIKTVQMLRFHLKAKGTITIKYKNQDRGSASVTNFFFLGVKKKLRVGPYFDGSVGKPESQHFFLGFKELKVNIFAYVCKHILPGT